LGSVSKRSISFEQISQFLPDVKEENPMTSWNIKPLQSESNTLGSNFIYLPRRSNGVDQTLKIDDMLKMPVQNLKLSHCCG